MSLIMKQKIYQFVVVILVIINSITLIAQVDYGDIDYLNCINTLFSVIFSIEYIVRLVNSEKKLSFVFKFYNLVDFIAR